MDSKKITFQRANAGGVLRAVPIRVLIHTAWARCRRLLRRNDPAAFGVLPTQNSPFEDYRP
jgi:hypothetical protein